MKFKVGQTVRLINNSGMSANVGATAVIYSVSYMFLGVNWKTNSRSQCSGEYYPDKFEPVVKIGKQLVFDFMR